MKVTRLACDFGAGIDRRFSVRGWFWFGETGFRHSPAHFQAMIDDAFAFFANKLGYDHKPAENNIAVNNTHVYGGGYTGD